MTPELTREEKLKRLNSRSITLDKIQKPSEPSINKEPTPISLEDKAKALKEKSDNTIEELRTIKKESKKESWVDFAKDTALQGARGVAQAFTWPLELLKSASKGYAMSQSGEIERDLREMGKPFDPEVYSRAVEQAGEYIPSQSSLESSIQKQTGFEFEPQTKHGEFINKAAQIAGMTRGNVINKILSGIAGSGTTQAFKQAGVNDTLSEILGDVVGGAGSISKHRAKLTPQTEAMLSTSEKHGLPLYKFQTLEKNDLTKSTLSKNKSSRLKNELGESSKEALYKIVDKNIPLSEKRSLGVNLDELAQESYAHARDLAKAKEVKFDASKISKNIEHEVERIKGLSGSPSTAKQEAINILEREAKALKNKSLTPEQLIEQHMDYNSNVKDIYKMQHISDKKEVVGAYKTLNDEIKKAIKESAGDDVFKAFDEANKIYSQSNHLKKTEKLIEKAFEGGEYNPKKLTQLIEKRGQDLNLAIGKDGTKQLREISHYGERATQNIKELSKSKGGSEEILKWGSMAHLLFNMSLPKVSAMLLGTSGINYMRGLLLTQPVTRTAYNRIIQDAAKGTFKNMGANFHALEKGIEKEFGGMQNLMKEAEKQKK